MVNSKSNNYITISFISYLNISNRTDNNKC